MFEKYILDNKLNIIGNICDLITFPSISVEETNSPFPFGKDCSDCLKHFLHLANSLGFRTKNVDGYCGWAEFGEGKELIGIVGHLDVVPAINEDWMYSPFVPTIANNCIYGRGAIDDKGPVVSTLYAMKSVMDYLNENNILLNKRVRLIVGLNEEKDWKCIDYYKKHEEIPSLGFSPDADFPCIYAEKSVISLFLSDNISKIVYNSAKNKYSNSLIPITIENIDCMNNAINVVPKFCSVILKINNPQITANIINICKNLIHKFSYEIDLYKIDSSHIKLTSYGKASHSAHPELGNNAITKLIIVLNELFKNLNMSFPLFQNFCTLIGDDYTGTNLNLNITDESGFLTLNTSKLYIEDGKVYIGINLRVPVSKTPDEIIDTFEKAFPDQVTLGRIQPSLFIDKKSNLVQKLCGIFNETCGTDLEPIAIGGATYARAFNNFVCFGMNFPGDKDMCHQTDEFIDIDKLMLATNIYANAIYELMK